MKTYNREVETKEYIYRCTVKIANTPEHTYMIPKKVHKHSGIIYRVRNPANIENRT